jgi:HEAT repeat protein
MKDEADLIKLELAKVGVFINDIYELVNTSKPYPNAIPVLLDLLKYGIKNRIVKEGVIRALAVKEAKGIACTVLLEEYNRLPKDEMLLRWTIGNTVFITISDNDVNGILTIVQNKENGYSRQMFVAALGKTTSEEAEDVLIKLLDDEEVTPHALEALGRMKSNKAKQSIMALLKHPKSLIRKEAQKALKKLS